MVRFLEETVEVVLIGIGDGFELRPVERVESDEKNVLFSWTGGGHRCGLRQILSFVHPTGRPGSLIYTVDTVRSLLSIMVIRRTQSEAISDTRRNS